MDIIDFNVPEYSILVHTKPVDSVFRGSDWLLKLRVVFTSVGSLKLSNNFREGGGGGGEPRREKGGFLGINTTVQFDRFFQGSLLW